MDKAKDIPEDVLEGIRYLLEKMTTPWCPLCNTRHPLSNPCKETK